MKKITRQAILAFTALFMTGGLHAAPILIDFQGQSAGNLASYTESGVTFTGEAPSTSLRVANLSGRIGILGEGSPFQPVRAVHATDLFSLVTVELGDASTDTDNLFLRGYDAVGNLLAESTDFLSGTGYRTLSISGMFSYVLAGSTSSINNSSVILDNFWFETKAAIPEPSTVLMFGFGILLLASHRRLFRKK